MHANRACLLGLLAAAVPAGTGLAAESGADEQDRGWQLEMLFDPSPQQLKMEREGRVMIYEGLRDTDVIRAMREQWHRVESMMFINTIITDSRGRAKRDQDSGALVFEDDGC